MAPISTPGLKTIIVTGTYQNAVSGAGETGFVNFIPSVPSLTDQTDMVELTIQPFSAPLPGTIGGGNSMGGNGHFSITIPTTDNTSMYPQQFTYVIEELVSNMASRTTRNVQIPSTLGSTVDITKILQPYI
jgi:hypothetical protein